MHNDELAGKELQAIPNRCVRVDDGAYGQFDYGFRP
jgi:hypothetical protein